MVLSLTAKGLTTGEVSAHLAEVYGAEVSRETVSKITDRILEEMADWLNCPLERVYAAVLHRRDRGQGPRRASHQPAGLHRHRRGR